MTWCVKVVGCTYHLNPIITIPGVLLVRCWNLAGVIDVLVIQRVAQSMA